MTQHMNYHGACTICPWKEYILQILSIVLYMSFRSRWLIVFFRFYVFLLIFFCLIVVHCPEQGVKISSHNGRFFYFSLIPSVFMYFEVLLLSTQILWLCLHNPLIYDIATFISGNALCFEALNLILIQPFQPFYAYHFHTVSFSCPFTFTL